MKTLKFVLPTIIILAFALSLSAAVIEERNPHGVLEKNGMVVGKPFPMEFALIAPFGSQPSGAAHAFCLALTSEQIGFAIDTLEALGIDGLLAEGQANSLVSKLQIAQIQLSTENIVAVFKQLEEFINKINFYTKKGKLTPDNGMLLINSTLSVMCRT